MDSSTYVNDEAFRGIPRELIPDLQGMISESEASQPKSSDFTAWNGVCIMNSVWKNEQHPSFISFISSFLQTNSYGLKFVPIAPDFIFNSGGVSVAFVFVTDWASSDAASIFSKTRKLTGQFAHFYVVVTLPTNAQNDTFTRSFFKHGIELGRPTFIPVKDLEMGFEKIVRLAHAHGACKRQNARAKLKAEREKSVLSMDIFVKVLTSIPGIDRHDATALNQTIGSIEAVAKASKDYILDNTDLSTEKAETISRFFNDPKYHLGPTIK